MPASLTRVCPRCSVARQTPADFREIGDLGPGRPPKFCRSCREEVPALQEAHYENRANRETGRERAHLLSLRTEAEIAGYRRWAHPHGLKTCPEVAGCGMALPFEAFSTNRHQGDGLAPICRACSAEHRALLPLRSAA